MKMIEICKFFNKRRVASNCMKINLVNDSDVNKNYNTIPNISIKCLFMKKKVHFSDCNAQIVCECKVQQPICWNAEKKAEFYSQEEKKSIKYLKKC